MFEEEDRNDLEEAQRAVPAVSSFSQPILNQGLPTPVLQLSRLIVQKPFNLVDFFEFRVVVSFLVFS
jgi:hypothetical protein